MASSPQAITPQTPADLNPVSQYTNYSETPSKRILTVELFDHAHIVRPPPPPVAVVQIGNKGVLLSSSQSPITGLRFRVPPSTTEGHCHDGHWHGGVEIQVSTLNPPSSSKWPFPSGFLRTRNVVTTMYSFPCISNNRIMNPQHSLYAYHSKHPFVEKSKEFPLKLYT
jgi:hypothetical protein